MVTIKLENLIDFVADVFAHADSSPEESRRIATYLTTANLTGHDSHGVIRVPVYMRWKKMGRWFPTRQWRFSSIRRRWRLSMAGSDTDLTPQAVRIGIQKCKSAGLAAV